MTNNYERTLKAAALKATDMWYDEIKEYIIIHSMFGTIGAENMVFEIPIICNSFPVFTGTFDYAEADLKKSHTLVFGSP